MNKINILGGAALLALAGAALAQPPGGPRGPGAQRPDRNADVTRQQVIERTDERFARLDANRDGRFTPEEARQRGEQRREQRAERMFERMDLDRNGSITREEMARARAQHQAQRGERGPGARGAGMRHRRMGMRHGGPGGPGMRGQRLFGEQGFVTAEQFRTRALERFDRADADRNGVVTAAERQAARERRRERRQERRPG
ncbi:MAG TPA: EF-hand domain-containing protein [Allosphingosinicella sp.]|nr:EF-hand domain-containing protein [Allosphingosinicella sp.]